jgi:hypothetical protein
MSKKSTKAKKSPVTAFTNPIQEDDETPDVESGQKLVLGDAMDQKWADDASGKTASDAAAVEKAKQDALPKTSLHTMDMDSPTDLTAEEIDDLTFAFEACDLDDGGTVDIEVGERVLSLHA